jgi:hypothetical protein
MKHLMLFEEYNTVSITKMEPITYTAPSGDWDAMHSFQSRKKDGFGGKMNDKIEKKLLELWEKGINPEVKSLKVKMDESNWKVTIDVEVGPSSDGKAWMGITSRGGAGGNTGTSAASIRAQNQIDKKLKDLKNDIGDSATEKFETKKLLDFEYDSNNKKTHVRQLFYTYTNPKKYPKENPNAKKPNEESK